MVCLCTCLHTLGNGLERFIGSVVANVTSTTRDKSCCTWNRTKEAIKGIVAGTEILGVVDNGHSWAWIARLRDRNTKNNPAGFSHSPH